MSLSLILEYLFFGWLSVQVMHAIFKLRKKKKDWFRLAFKCNRVLSNAQSHKFFMVNNESTTFDRNKKNQKKYVIEIFFCGLTLN